MSLGPYHIISGLKLAEEVMGTLRKENFYLVSEGNL